jgi:BirA family transcriptional regulator, biotin operon repressor / biotin---[acetyl-CoA-carboxylase] ligase
MKPKSYEYNTCMDQRQVQTRLAHLSFSKIRFYTSVGSTNDLAADWAASGVDDLALVVADEQTRGRGRTGRRWLTPPDSALAFSLVIRPPDDLQLTYPAHLTALGALAVCETLRTHYALPAEIKWPNDVLLDGKKVCGVLVESVWTGDRLEAAILGVGINVTRQSVPADEFLLFPATCVEDHLKMPVSRLDLLVQILENLLAWRSGVGGIEFWRAWNLHLAYQQQTVRVILPDGQQIVGQVSGLSHAGDLLLRLPGGQTQAIQVGEVNVRLVDTAQE